LSLKQQFISDYGLKFELPAFRILDSQFYPTNP
jgi:hypothetical protein